MNRMFGRASDVILRLLVPNKEAEAGWIGCCDIRICSYSTNTYPFYKCAHCVDPRC